MRDIELNYQYVDACDTVKATAVWAERTADESSRKTAAQIFADPDFSMIPSRSEHAFVEVAVNKYDGTGLIPENPTTGIRNGILLRFTVTPSGIEDEAEVKLDITRRIEINVWTVDDLGNITLHAISRPWPVEAEKPNDDKFIKDESIEPDSDRYMFAYDVPGRELETTAPTNDLYVFRMNAEEFVRVSFNGTRPIGNEIMGSRSSLYTIWHVRHRFQEDTGQYDRTSQAAQDNDIGFGHFPIGTAP